MNTLLSTHVDEHNHTHPPSPLQTVSRVRSVSFADRVALHLGLALITWSRRPRTVASQSRSSVQARRAQLVQQVEREWQAERELRLRQATR